ncbi:MAG: hypothetical protein IPL96_00005 [Holophagaceae bacterium]|nr:hypothetical protein [Holophagaceae bacterium]
MQPIPPGKHHWLDPDWPSFLGAVPAQTKLDIRNSLDDRYTYLVRRYTGLDLVCKGLAVEILGAFYHPDALKKEAMIRELRTERLLQQARMISADPTLHAHHWAASLTRKELRLWLAMGRRVAWDQIGALVPEAPGSVFARVLDLIEEGEAEVVRVPMRKGSVEAVALTAFGFSRILEDEPRQGGRGFEPHRKTTPGAEYHDMAVLDAIHYLSHHAFEGGDQLVDVILEDGLKARDPLHQKGVADVRLGLINKFGFRTWVDVEVMGRGRRYVGFHRNEHASGVLRVGFDPFGRPGDARIILRIGR